MRSSHPAGGWGSGSGQLPGRQGATQAGARSSPLRASSWDPPGGPPPSGDARTGRCLPLQREMDLTWSSSGGRKMRSWPCPWGPEFAPAAHLGRLLEGRCSVPGVVRHERQARATVGGAGGRGGAPSGRAVGAPAARPPGIVPTCRWARHAALAGVPPGTSGRCADRRVPGLRMRGDPSPGEAAVRSRSKQDVAARQQPGGLGGKSRDTVAAWSSEGAAPRRTARSAASAQAGGSPRRAQAGVSGWSQPRAAPGEPWVSALALPPTAAVTARFP